MNTLPILVVALCIFALAYRYYSAFSRESGARMIGYGTRVARYVLQELMGKLGVVVAGAARRCLAALHGERIPAEAAGPPAVADGPRWAAADAARAAQAREAARQ